MQAVQLGYISVTHGQLRYHGDGNHGRDLGASPRGRRGRPRLPRGDVAGRRRRKAAAAWQAMFQLWSQGWHCSTLSVRNGQIQPFADAYWPMAL